MHLKAFTALTLCLVFNLLPLGYADPLQNAHYDIQEEAQVDFKQMQPHLDLLWRSSVERNPTLVLALQKLAQKAGMKDAQQMDKKSWTKSVLGNIVSLGGMGSAVALGNPAPLIGSGIISSLTAEPQAAQELSAVSSTDLVILVREVERVQSQLIENYVQFRHSVDEEKHLEHTLHQLQLQSVNVAQGFHTPSDKVNALIIDLGTKLEKTKQKTETFRNLLILSAGEEPVKSIEQDLRRQAI